MFGNIGLMELVVVLIVAALLVWPATRVCRKAGFSPWLGLAIIVPLANIILLWYLALAEWPSRPAGAR